MLGQIRAGRLRALATPAPARMQALPEVPTLTELGYAVDVRDWHGIVAAAATPQPVITRLEAALSEVLARADVKERLAAVVCSPQNRARRPSARSSGPSCRNGRAS